MNYDDETLMAYADGELDAKTRSEIAAAVEKDPELAHRVEKHRALRARVSGAFEKVLDQSVPERLAQIARGGAGSASESAASRGKVLQFPTRTAHAPVTAWHAREWIAMAASLMLGLFLSWRIFAPAESELLVAGNDALMAGGALAHALDNQLASEQRGAEPVLIGLTFKAREGNYCRSFVLSESRTAGLACRAGPGWQVSATDSAPLPQGGMQQASSALTPAILRAIEARADGEALDAEAEKSAQLSGWNAGIASR
ncbi:MAG TPA: hypothetical protein VFS58_01180 [Steroidobacteraceae bacterium]|nr:hypothetical protein [Steroidobacteraceae bacterium]